MSKLAGFKKVLLGSACMLGLALTSQAQAQVANYYDNNVVVDLSVIDDNGLGNKQPSIANPIYQAKLPPVGMPKSTFHGLPQNAQAPVALSTAKLRLPASKPASRIVLRKPTGQQAKPTLPTNRLAKADSIKLKQPIAPKPMPKKVIVAKAPPKPLVKPVQMAKPAPAPKKVESPKPTPAPVKPVDVVKAAPAPKPMIKKTVEKSAPAPVPAPAPAKIMAEAPPPPPPSAVEPKKVVSAMKAEPTKPVTTTAAIPPSSEASVRIAFDSGQSKMPSSAQGNLKSLADTLRQQPDDRVQLLAYAGGENLSASKARRLSLSRALAVRSYLIGKGVRSTRIDVRALGNKTTQEPLDRVDVQITPR